ncbi:LADA_0A01618g1_1 [Lachancea dasiensis]|uniref:LADA_0A01618g1_1 n=1 Tax=Lachancea dasiensis TaxID=1072105 RepID=A0A1G4IMP6_9SACH|nr:LADA_0A01618g1_1 [Lachancea dasiensis]
MIAGSQLKSIDDCVLIHQNMMLLQNVADLERPAIDYYHFDFSHEHPMAMPQTWNVLLHMGKHKLLRLPSCSAENDSDYQMYVKRLHHCLWRRWSIAHYRLQEKKLDPRRINWHKELDFTVLYGPALCVGDSTDGPGVEGGHREAALCGLYSTTTKRQNNIASWLGEDHSDVDDLAAACLSSSLESRDSSIFDDVPNKTCLRRNSHKRYGRRRPLRFDSEVLRRDIDVYGSLYERKIRINDTYMSFPEDDNSDLEPEYHHIQHSAEDWDSDDEFLLDVM